LLEIDCVLINNINTFIEYLHSELNILHVIRQFRLDGLLISALEVLAMNRVGDHNICSRLYPAEEELGPFAVELGSY